MIFSFYQYRSGCVFYCSRIARKAEAGRGGILRSINRSATCPAMWRLTFSGGGRSVRLSANGCQPHRPNTALIFCVAGYHLGLLRTFHEYSLNFYIRTELFCVPSTFARCFRALSGDSFRTAANSSQSRRPTLLRKSLSVVASLFSERIRRSSFS